MYKTTEAAKLLEHVDGDVVVSVMVDYIVEENCFLLILVPFKDPFNSC